MSPRHLFIRFLSAGEKRPRATVTLTRPIRDEDWDDIVYWVQGLPSKYGLDRKRLGVNVVEAEPMREAGE